MRNRKREKRKLLFSIIGLSLFLVLTTVFIYFPKQEMLLSSISFIQNQNRFYIEDLSDGIMLRNAYPVTDEVGLSSDAYTFKIVNNSNSKITYQIKFNNNEKEALAQGKEVLANKYLRYSLNIGNDTVVEATNLLDDGILYTATIDAKSETVFNFRMWLDWNADNEAMDKVFIGQIELQEIK